MDISQKMNKGAKFLIFIGIFVLFIALLILIDNNTEGSNIAQNEPGNLYVSIDTQNRIEHENYLFFGSRTGKYYYDISCSDSTIIEPKNRIYFTNGVEAQYGGYSYSNNCR
ncbi:hypothetical protein KC852_00635 [Candidatus Nomurabacteria bacterium]|nr:hypothetical protein [Candidatus Nomurabacteria bacterium]